MATNQREVEAEIDRLYPVDNHFCARDGSAMEHLEHRKEYICLLCGETRKESEVKKMIVAKRSRECMNCHSHPIMDCMKFCSILDKYRMGWSFAEIKRYYKLTDNEFKKAWNNICDIECLIMKPLEQDKLAAHDAKQSEK